MNWRCVKVSCLVIAAMFATATSSYSDSSSSEIRDSALKGIELCLKRNEAASRECRSMNKNVQTLMDVYRQGDKTVLPTLLHFTYLTDFFGEALIGDPDGFLATVSDLPELSQQAVAIGVSGRPIGLQRPRFEAIRATLMAVPDSSPNYPVAKACLRTLETENASFIENYFPPHTFSGRAGDITVRSLSRTLRLLEEKPLWPPALETTRTYRITVLPCLAVPESATLTVLGDGSGHIDYRTLDVRRHRLSVDKSKSVNSKRVSDISSLLDQIQFWQLPTESSQLGLDGAYWVLEAVQDGKYHVVLRWCPGKASSGRVGRNLLKLAGHRASGTY